MNITFQQVDAFHAVVSSGSVNGASALLGVSQPVISRLISDLEKEVGFALFNRQGRVLVPMPEGRMLVAEVRQAVTGVGISRTRHASSPLSGIPLSSLSQSPALSVAGPGSYCPHM